MIYSLSIDVMIYSLSIDVMIQSLRLLKMYFMYKASTSGETAPFVC